MRFSLGNIVIGQVSRHTDNKSPPAYADLANDGDPTTCSYTDNTARTENNYAFWRVWLEYNMTFTDFRILTKSSHTGTHKELIRKIQVRVFLTQISEEHIFNIT